jgi:hypothetical protein
MRGVFLAWAVGIIMSTSYVFIWVVSTLILGNQGSLYVYAVRPQQLDVLQIPTPTNTPLLNLLAIVVLSGFMTLLLEKLRSRI